MRLNTTCSATETSQTIENFAGSKCSYYSSQNKKNEGTDKTVHMRRLFCAFVVPMQQSQVFSHQGPIGFPKRSCSNKPAQLQ